MGFRTWLYKQLHSVKPPKPRVTRKDWITMGPLEKWRNFAYLPVKFFLHLLLLVVLTYHGMYRMNTNRALASGQATVCRFFAPNSSWVEGRFAQPQHSTSAVVESIELAVNNYFEFQSSSVELVDGAFGPHYFTELPNLPGPILRVERYEAWNLTNRAIDEIFRETFGRRVNISSYELTPENPLGPLANSTMLERKHFFASLKALTLTLKYYQADVSRAPKPGCFLWHVELSWGQPQGGLTTRTLSTAASACDLGHVTGWSRETRGMLALLALEVLAASIHLLLSLRALFSSFRLYRVAASVIQRSQDEPVFHGQHHSSTQAAMHQRSIVLTGLEKLTGAWGVLKRLRTFVRISDINAIIYCSLAVAVAPLDMLVQTNTLTNIDHSYLNLLLGLDIFLVYLQFVVYHNLFPKFFFLNDVLARAIPQVLNVTLGVLPLWIAFFVSSFVFFSAYDPDFVSPPKSSAVLFGVINGDEVIDTFRRSSINHVAANIVARLFMTCLFVFFAYCFIENLVVILEEAHRLHKHERELGHRVDAPLADDDVLAGGGWLDPDTETDMDSVAPPATPRPNAIRQTFMQTLRAMRRRKKQEDEAHRREYES